MSERIPQTSVQVTVAPLRPLGGNGLNSNGALSPAAKLGNHLIIEGQNGSGFIDPGLDPELKRLAAKIVTASIKGPLVVEQTESLKPPVEGVNATEIYFRDIVEVSRISPQQEILYSKQIEGAKEARALLETRSDLSVDEKKALTEMLRIGDQVTREFTEANLRLVVSIAKKYTGRGLTILDLAQEGNLGLMIAVEKYNWRRGFRFSSYAPWWIKQTIRNALLAQPRDIKIPSYVLQELNKIKKAAGFLLQELGRNPTYEEIGHVLNMNPGRVEDISQAAVKVISYDKPPVSADGESDIVALSSRIPDREAVDPEEYVIERLLAFRVEEVLNTLSPKRQYVLRLRNGIGEKGSKKTLQEVGDELGVSRERVRQIEAAALKKLRDPMVTGDLENYFGQG